MKKRTDLIYLVPSLCGMLAFFIVPFFDALGYAFTDNAFTRCFVGLENFKDLFQNPYFRLAMKNTALFTVVAVVFLCEKKWREKIW